MFLFHFMLFFNKPCLLVMTEILRTSIYSTIYRISVYIYEKHTGIFQNHHHLLFAVN